MDLASWIIVGVLIVLAAVGVGLWNRYGKGRAPIGGLDRDGEKDVRDAEATRDRYGGIGGAGGGGNVGGGGI
jgi:hypothetical protein